MGIVARFNLLSLVSYHHPIGNHIKADNLYFPNNLWNY